MWFGRDWDYEPLIGVAGSIIALVCADKYTGLPKLNKWDERLAQKFLSELPSSSSGIVILRDHDFHNSFILDYWKPMNDFRYYWDHPDHKFNDKTLNSEMAKFLSTLHELIKLIGINTSPTHANPDVQKIHEHAGEKIIEEMNDLASEAYKQYSEICALLRKYNFEPVA